MKIYEKIDFTIYFHVKNFFNFKLNNCVFLDDFNRVKLIADNENKSRKSNYINASYINVIFFSFNFSYYNCLIQIDNLLLSYIAAQGPIGADESRGGQRLNTVADFWQMIWQENINTIVTLTGCVENGRVIFFFVT